jgi:hypothetical protein
MNCYHFCCTILTNNAALIVTVFAALLIAENAALLFTDYIQLQIQAILAVR